MQSLLMLLIIICIVFQQIKEILIRGRGIEHSLRDMDQSEKPAFHTTKLLTTWWDLVDHYLLAVMFAVSLASVGLQATQDRLICIPAVNCSDFAKNDSVVRNWSEFSNVLDICNGSPSFVVLTKMSDRRQYDYADNECYKKMDRFSAYYSLFFLAEAVILLAISNFWQKYPSSASVLAYCEHLLSEFIKGELLVPTNYDSDIVICEEGQGGKQTPEEQKLFKRLKAFEICYSKEINKYNLGSVTGQYRLRGVVGLIVTIILLAINVSYYFLGARWTQCHLDGHVTFSTKHRFFQCTRSMGTYFYVGSILLIVFLCLHLIFVLGSFLWSVTGERRGPEYEITSNLDTLLTYKGDAAFLFHFLDKSNYGFLIAVIKYLYNKENIA